MKFNFGMPEILAILSIFFYSQDKTMAYILISLAVLGSCFKFLIDFSSQNSELSLLKKRVIMSDEERKSVLAKMVTLKNINDGYYGDLD